MATIMNRLRLIPSLLLLLFLPITTTTIKPPAVSTPCTTGTAYTQIPTPTALPSAYRIPALFMTQHTLRNYTIPFSPQWPLNNSTWSEFLWLCDTNCGYNKNPQPCASYLAFYGTTGYTCQFLKAAMCESTFVGVEPGEGGEFRGAVAYNRVCSD